MEGDMRRGLFSGLVAVTSGAIVIACSIGSSSPPPDQSVSEFCADWAKAICQLSNGQCAFSQSVCATYQTSVCMAYVNTAQSGTREYRQSSGKACIDALNSAYGNNPSSISAMVLANVNSTCSKAVSGNQQSDQPCTGDTDCSGSLVCAPILGQSGSVCASVNKKNLGDICGDPGDTCQGDSYCAPQPGAAPKCVATPSTGSSCSMGIPCGSSNRCLNGTCQPRGAAGDPCTTNDDCSTLVPYCDTYPPAGCAKGLSFARGSIDCNGIAGLDRPDAGGM
jgi:hypothetical protein